MRTRLFVLLSCALNLAFTTAAFAKDNEAKREFLSPYDNSGTWTFVWENDYFANTDRNYTNGVRMSYISGFKKPNGVSKFVAENILGANDEAGIRRGFAVGHSIFTPQDISTATPLPDQHPYAGWLYGEYTVVVEQRNVVDQFTLQTGMVGPSAQGEFVQNNWHKLINGDPANGWDNQIKNEFGMVLSYDRKMRALLSVGDSSFGADATPSFGWSVGNIHTNARVGVTFRLGTDLTNDYGPPRVRPSLAGSGFFAPKKKFSWYLFAGASGTAVAQNIFLDGSLFRDGDPSVDSNTFFGDFQVGIAMQVRRAQIAYTYVVRTKEFTQQENEQEFGAVSISVKF